MKDDFLTALIGNPARARIIRVFAFAPSESFSLAQAAKRAGTSGKLAAKEIATLEKLGVLKKSKVSIVLKNGKEVQGKQKEERWAYDLAFKHAAALSKFVHEVSPVQYKAIVEALKKSGRLGTVVLSGSFMGDPSRPAELIVAADGIHEGRLEAAVRALEPKFGREIRYAVFTIPEFRYRLTIQDRLIRDTLDFPHLVLLDRSRLL